MKKSKLFLRKICVLISCLVLFFSVSFNSYAITNGNFVFLPDISGDQLKQLYVPVYPTTYVGQNNPRGTYAGIFTVNYYFYVTGSKSYATGGSVWIRYPILFQTVAPTGSFTNQITLSLVNVKCTDIYENPVNCAASGNLNQSYSATVSGGYSYSPVYYIGYNIFPTGNDFSNYCKFTVTYAVTSNLPITYVKLNDASATTGNMFTLTTPPSKQNDSANLADINTGIGQTNDKLDNLTDGYDKSSIDSTNQQLGNNLDSFDQAEDAAIDSVKDYFNDIDQPIDFFNVGTFLASNSFVWTYLQGLYEHLGDAKIVVNVVLALTVAFSFIGLGRYIWKAIDREDSS